MNKFLKRNYLKKMLMEIPSLVMLSRENNLFKYIDSKIKAES